MLSIFHASIITADSRTEIESPDTDKSRPELILQTGHNETVKAVVFSPDNRWVASGSFDNTIKIWDVETGREIRSMTGHTGAVKALACSPDGKFLASGGNDRIVRIWDVASGEEINKFEDQTGSIETVVFSPDGKRLASGGSDNKIILRDVGSKQPLFTFTGHTSTITALAFSPDGSLLASGSSDQTVKIWDTLKGKSLRNLKWHTDGITVLRFSESGSMIASASADKTVRLWQVANGNKLANFPGHSSTIFALSFLSEEKLMSADSSGVIKTWNTMAKHDLLSSVSSSDDKDFVSQSASFSRDGAMLAIGNGNGTATISDTKTGKNLNTLENHTIGIHGLAFSTDRRWMAAASFDNSVKLWDLESGENLPSLRGHTGRVNCVAFSPDNRRIVTGSLDNTIRVWDTVSLKSLDILKGHVLPGVSSYIESIAVSSDGKFIVAGSNDNTIGIWNLETKRPPRFLKEHAGEVTSVSISPNNQIIASASLDATIRLWDIVTGTLVRIIQSKSGAVTAVAFSPDGKLLVSGGVDRAVSIWEVETGKPLQTLPGHAGKITSVSFSSDGTQIISSSQDKTVRVWNVANGREIRLLTGHAGSVSSVAFMPDERWLASSSEDGSIIIWNKENGKRLASLLSLRKSEDWLVVTPEGFFDGSQPSWSQISWRFEKNTFNVRPVEEFFSEFWVPGMLGDLLNDRKLPSNTDISVKDRRQPVLKMMLADAKPSPALADQNLTVRIEVSQAPAGAKDVRLFRNGVLVKIWRNDVLKGKPSAVLEWTLPIVAGENRLTAYAFNSDDIKSKDRSLTVTGVTGLTQKAVMYVLAIGVNEYANADYNLNYAKDDAMEFAREFKRQQDKLNNFKSVEVTQLIDANATKANILKSLADFSAKVKPEDSLVVFFAGHGIADQKRFYMIPHDLGYMGRLWDQGTAGFQKIVASSLSDEDLERAVENIDAGQMLLIIDACDSGQAIAPQEKRQGPMNSKGLAQLAYEKGIYILTAAQGFQAAKEDDRLGHGYLTFALVEEGLKAGAADQDPKDGQVLLREWLDYAIKRVPVIDKEESEKEGRRGRQLEREKSKGTGKADIQGLQRPKVFYRREPEPQPLVVARP